MRLVRNATLEQVLEVAPPAEETRQTIRDCGGDVWGLWEYSLADVGYILTQNRNSPIDAVRELYDARMASHDHDVTERERHAALLKDFIESDFRCPPILISCEVVAPPWRRQVIDGGHRVFAAFDHMRTHPDRTLRVYWNRLHDDAR